MLEIMVMYMDIDGLPRCYATGLVESNSDLDKIKSVASDMLDKYIAGKLYSGLISRSEYSVSVEVVD